MAPLVDAARRVSLVAARTAPVMLTFSPGEVVLEAGAGGEAQAREALAAEYDGPDLSIAFNPGYLLDGLGALDSDSVHVGFATRRPGGGAAQARRLHRKSTDAGPDYRYLLMPVRLSG